MSDLKNIKDILQNYEVEYDHQDWIRLEKDLPKPGMSGMTKTLLVASTIIITVASVILLSNLFDSNTQTDNNKTEQVAENTNNNNETTTITNTENNNTNNTNLNNESNSSNNNTVNINNNTNTNSNTNNTESINTLSDENENSSENNTINNIDDRLDETETNISNTNKPDLSKIIFKYEVSDKCVPVSVTFIAENVPENCEVIWNTDDNTRVYGTKAEHLYLKDGTFYPKVSISYNNSILENENLNTFELYKPTEGKIIFDNSENLYYFSCDNEEELEYLWTIDNQEFGEREVSYEFNKTAEYTINLSIVNQFGCKSESSALVNVHIEHVFYLPNAFMPNSNGINSEFGPIGKNMNFASYQLLIVDGNGKLVFSSNNVEDKWNGKINNIGENAKPGYYLWEVNTIDEFGNIQTKKGRVNLIWN